MPISSTKLVMSWPGRNVKHIGSDMPLKQIPTARTYLVYALPLHPDIRFLRNPRTFRIYMFLAILAVAATYFGVNFLPSLHSYS